MYEYKYMHDCRCTQMCMCIARVQTKYGYYAERSSTHTYFFVNPVRANSPDVGQREERAVSGRCRLGGEGGNVGGEPWNLTQKSAQSRALCR